MNIISSTGRGISMKVGDFPEIILINISEINLIKTYPEEKSNRVKVIVSWKNGKKDYFFGTEEEIQLIVDKWEDANLETKQERCK